MVTQLFPEKKQVQLEGLYLGQRLVEISTRIERSLVITDFLSDRNEVIAKADEHRRFQVPDEIRNGSDWRLFQELMAQADVIISGENYLKRFARIGSAAEDILFQFEPGRGFEELGEWRLISGYKKRSPDLAIVSRRLDFQLPEGILKNDRKIIVFTPDAMTNSMQARHLTNAGVAVVGSGEAGVEADRMIAALNLELGYRVIMMATGPTVLRLLLEANRLDLLYITKARLEIPFDDPASVKTLFSDGEKSDTLKGFSVAHRYLQENVSAENGNRISQLFLRLDRNGALAGRQ
jgi:hypothetical protein